MFIKTSFIATFLFIICSSSFAHIFDLEEKKPVLENGFEYGYIIKSEQIKNAGGEDYGRFVISLYVSNKSNCTKIYAERVSAFSGETPNLLATFNCNNANGKRLTSKNGSVKARDFYINLKRNVDGKETAKAVKAGYIFRNAETLKEDIIVLVPKAERPVIQCTANSLPELQ